jgi:hypothetical protein
MRRTGRLIQPPIMSGNAPPVGGPDREIRCLEVVVLWPPLSSLFLLERCCFFTELSHNFPQLHILRLQVRDGARMGDPGQ